MIYGHHPHTLQDVLDSYFEKRVLQPRSMKTLESSVNSLQGWMNTESAPIASITPEVLNKWLGAMTCKPRTIIKHRGNILSLLRDASDDGWCAEPNSRKIRRPKRPKPLPKAWSIGELRRVCDVCDNLPGTMRRHGVIIPTCIYFGCLPRFAYQTGLRRGNLFSLEQDDVRDDGRLYLKHEKTGEPHVCSVSAEALALFRQLPGQYPLQWNHNDNKNFYRRWRKICTAAGVPYGGLHRIRKTAATQVWLEAQDNPSRVQQFLGHLTPDMWRHYVDRSQGDQLPPRPPEL